MGYDKMSIKEGMENRRTIYALNKSIPVDKKRIQEVVRTAIETVPSSFNLQSARLVVLRGDEHDKFWGFTRDILKSVVPEDKWEYTRARVQGFNDAFGTVLFYEDPEPVKMLQSKFPQYADKFPHWSEHTSAMHQYALWTSLEAEGFGCNLQHYNPLPDQKAAETWNIPLEWSLKAQLVFGGLKDRARENLAARVQTKPVEERVFVHGG
ncbi:nitroreductase family protein [Piedraia hortae CBS 480.64]|uniref:Nitroreductase family protein n=1 Tax=Piedraia hortae CBS 480.64 TaxID=1314780 RepID=A0A6A7BQ22_9PEZI|nr:nitroreductase family protein [Piedraia hortae CBS 480.64]